MRIVEVADYAELCRQAADKVVATVAAKPDAVLVLPTGNTPLGLYRELVARHRSGQVDFGRVRFVVLDEYARIDRADPRRLTLWLERALLDAIGAGAERVLAFDPGADPDAEAVRVESAIGGLGGIDLAVLGLGPNGHLGFNEPGSTFDSRARLVTLAGETIRSNAAYWGSRARVPVAGLTLGLGTLRQARQLLLLVSGAAKIDIYRKFRDGPVGPSLPATLLRMLDDATVLVDRAALAGSS